MIKFVVDLQQVDGFLQVLWVSPAIKLTTRSNWNIVESDVKTHKPTVIKLHRFSYISIGNSLESNNGQLFSTKDSDNDQYRYKCTDYIHGAWWFSYCGNSSLNGKYLNKAADYNYVGITWMSWKRNWNSLKKTYMMIRRLWLSTKRQAHFININYFMV